MVRSSSIKKSGRFTDPSKVHFLNHKGKHFKVRGPRDVPRPPQGYPVIVQAGSSEAGKNLAAQACRSHFAVLRTEAESIAYRSDMDARLATFGRPPESFKLLPGILPIVGEGISEAEEKQQYLEHRCSMGRRRSALTWAGVDLSGYPLDGPVPDLHEEANYNGWRTWLALVRDDANRGLTIWQLARKISKRVECRSSSARQGKSQPSSKRGSTQELPTDTT